MSGPELNFSAIHKEFQPKIRRYLTRMVEEKEVDDLTQEVLIKISRSLESFREESHLSTWIYRIAANTALDRLRQREHREGIERELISKTDRDLQETEDFWTGEEKASLDQQIIRLEMNGCIREIIETLPSDYRSVLILSELEGFTDLEIGRILGITRQTVKIRLHRARSRLKKALSAACVFYRDERNVFACDRKSFQVRIETIPNPDQPEPKIGRQI